MNVELMLKDKFAARCIVEGLMSTPTHESVRLYNMEREQLGDPSQLQLEQLTKGEFIHALRSTALYEKTGDISFIHLSPLGGLHARIPYENAAEFRHLQAAYATFTHGAAKHSLFYQRSGLGLSAIGQALDGSHFFDESGRNATLESRVNKKDVNALKDAVYHFDDYRPLNLQPVNLH